KAGDLLEMFQGSVKSLDEARVMGRVANGMMVQMADNLRQLAGEVKANGGKKDLARFAKLYEQYHDMIVINRNFSRGFGQGLASQKKYFNISAIHSPESVKELIDNLGGDTHLAKIAEQISHTTDAIQAATLIRKSETRG